MSVAIPNLTKLSLVHALVCVELSGNKTPKPVPEDFIFKTVDSKKQHFVKVGTHSNASPHLHVEIVTQEYFRKGIPAAKGKRGDFDNLVADLIGHTGTAKVGAAYRIKLDDLPKDNWLRATYFQMGDDSDVSVSLRGAQFAIKGTPYDALEWEIVDSNKKIAEIRVRGDLEITFSESYLVDCVAFANDGLKLFAGKSHGPSSRTRSVSKQA